jgi:hypothetical protein
LKKIIIYYLIIVSVFLNYFFIPKQVYAADPKAMTSNFNRNDSIWERAPADSKTQKWQYSNTITYTGSDNKKHSVEAIYSDFEGEKSINASGQFNYETYDLPGDDRDRTGYVYHLGRFNIDGQTQSFSTTDSNYYILVLNTDSVHSSSNQMYVVKIIYKINYEDAVKPPGMTGQLFDFELKETSTKPNTNKDSTFYKVSSGGDTGVIGPYVKWLNEKVLPQSLGTTGFGSQNDLDPKKIPQQCKDLMIDPVSKSKFKDLDLLAQEIYLDNKETSPWKDEDEDLALYEKYYKSKNSTYPDKHGDFQDFLQEYQASIGEIENIPIQLISEQGENVVSKAASRYSIPLATVIGISVAGKAAAPPVINAGKAIGGKIGSKLSSVSNFFKGGIPKATEGLSAAEKLKLLPESVATKTGTQAAKAVTEAQARAILMGEGAGAAGEAGAVEAGAGIGAGALLAWGMVAIGATALGVEAYKQKVQDDAIKSVFKLTTAQLYARHHVAFHICMVRNNVTDGGFTKENLAQELMGLATADQLTTEAIDALKENLGELGKREYCPESIWKEPTTWFKSSLCALGMALYDGGQKLTDFALRQLFAVLGMTGDKGY